MVPLVELVRPFAQVLRAIVFRRFVLFLDTDSLAVVVVWDCGLVGCEVVGGSESG